MKNTFKNGKNKGLVALTLALAGTSGLALSANQASKAVANPREYQYDQNSNLFGPGYKATGKGDMAEMLNSHGITSDPITLFGMPLALLSTVGLVYLGNTRKGSYALSNHSYVLDENRSNSTDNDLAVIANIDPTAEKERKYA